MDDNAVTVSHLRGPGSEHWVPLLVALDAEDWHGAAQEQLWAEPVGDGLFRLCSTPFHAFELSMGDVVRGEARAAELVYTGLAEAGGHSSYRLILFEDDLSFQEFWQPLAALGCTCEEGPVVAVDIPAATDIYRVYGLLEAGEAAGVWEFEEGNCGHPLREDATQDAEDGDD